MNRTIEAMVRLSAKLGPMAAFGQMGAKLSDVNNKAAAFNRTQTLVTKGSHAATAAMLRFAAPAAIAYGAKRAVTEFAGIERTLTRIGINADASREQMAGVFQELQQIAQATATPVDNIVSGLDSLIASGKSLDEAMALIGSVSATAQAAGADFGQMATTADAVSNSFGITGDQMQSAFDILAKGGKAGKFELRDMAAELPSLAPAFAALGYEGEDGLKRLTAALQTVRMETGTSGEAATSFMDVLTKMNSVTVSNSFKKQFGVDLRNEMKKAKVAGEDTLEAFIRLSKEAVDGDMSKLPLLFTDKQMLIGMRALMNHTGDFTKLLGELGSAAGTVNGDLKRVLGDSQGAIDRMANSWDRLKTSLGEKIAPAAAATFDAASNTIDRQAAMDRGFEKKGMGFIESRLWTMLNAGNHAALSEVAYLGGWRSDEQRKMIAGYGEYAASRSAAPAYRPPRDTLPNLGPVVTTRDGQVLTIAPSPASAGVPLPVAKPNQTDMAIDRQDAERRALNIDMRREGINPIRGSAPSAAVSQDGISARPGQGVSELRELLEKLEPAGAQAGSDLAKGGDDAANAIAQAAPEAGNGFGDAAAARINASAAQAGATFGDAAAARIRAAAGSMRSSSGRDVNGPGDL